MRAHTDVCVKFLAQPGSSRRITSGLPVIRAQSGEVPLTDREGGYCYPFAGCHRLPENFQIAFYARVLWALLN